MVDKLNKFINYDLYRNKYLQSYIKSSRYTFKIQPLYRLKFNKIYKKYDYAYINPNIYELFLQKNLSSYYHGRFIIHYYNDYFLSLETIKTL